MRNKTLSDLTAERVEKLRKQRGWTRKQLAAACRSPKLTDSVIETIEYGRRGQDGRRRRDVTVDELVDLAAALGVTPAYLCLPDPRDADDVPLFGEHGTISWWDAGQWLVAEGTSQEISSDESGPILQNVSPEGSGHVPALWVESTAPFWAIKDYREKVNQAREDINYLHGVRNPRYLREPTAEQLAESAQEVRVVERRVGVAVRELHESMVNLVGRHGIVPPLPPGWVVDEMRRHGYEIPEKMPTPTAVDPRRIGPGGIVQADPPPGGWTREVEE